ncbi:MAG TPA: LLM class flavin-dependent oxidoreductase [Stellaceae bacterium]|nr:LLM class flavin-dependent oxidoreductase [Stellaceae bacterium]
MTPGLPEFGLRLSGALDPRRCVELARAADEGGFASVWFAENPLQRGVLATAGACAAATGRVRIGVGVVNPYMRHPVQIAMDFAALDTLSDGRAVFGVGSGIASPIARMGLTNDRPVAAVREAIEIIRALLAGDGVTTSGKVFSLAGSRLAFRPSRPNLPIYMAAGSDRALQVCGEIADGFIVSNLTPPSLTARLTAVVADAAVRAGRPKPHIVQYAPCAVGADGDAARQAVKRAIGETLILLWPVGDEWPQRREAVVAAGGIPREEFVAALARLRSGEDAATVLDERFVAGFAIAGPADECRAQAASYRAAGVDELVLSLGSVEEIAAFCGRHAA